LSLGSLDGRRKIAIYWQGGMRYNAYMRTELLSWFEREGLLLTSATMKVDEGTEAAVEDEIKITVRAPLLALSRASQDFRECPDPVLFGYPENALDLMILEDMHQFVLSWFERAVMAGMAYCLARYVLLAAGAL